jgi:SAM-dependent methyltransferase
MALDEAQFHSRTGVAISVASRFAFKRGFKNVGERLSRLKRHFVREVTNHNASFLEIAGKLSSDASADWQIYRFSMPTFLPVFALLHVVREHGWILDFGCGSGQASFLVCRMWPNTKIVCADYSFCSLYLAKKYFLPEASYVCLDGNYLLPFESGQFSTVFSSDTLQYIDSKLSLAQECRRVSSENAVTILPHLHNRLASPYAKSLTPAGYRKLFQDVEMRIIPEQEVIRSYFFDDALDLERDWTEEELAASEQGLSIIASKDSSRFRRLEGLWDQRIRSFRHLRINPAYRIAGQPGNWELTRRVQDRYARTMTQLDQICLPHTCNLTARWLDAEGLVEIQRTDPSQFVQLAKSLVILDLPERFMAQTARSRGRTGTPPGNNTAPVRRQPGILGKIMREL